MIEQHVINDINDRDLTTFLNSYEKFTFKKCGSSFRCVEHPSLSIKDDNRCFYWHSQGIGGYGALNWLTKVCNIDFISALKILTDGDISQFNTQQVYTTTKPAKPTKPAIPATPKELVLPKSSYDVTDIIDYLCDVRGISCDIIYYLLDNKLIFQDYKKNVVFVGYDENQLPKFACLRGTYDDGSGSNSFRKDCYGSDKKYSFNIKGNSENLYVFESPIDLLSHATMENIKFNNPTAYLRSNRLSLGGTSTTALKHFLSQNKISNIRLCLDNDAQGIKSANNIMQEFNTNYNVSINFPTTKDYNQDLLEHLSKQLL